MYLLDTIIKLMNKTKKIIKNYGYFKFLLLCKIISIDKLSIHRYNTHTNM